MRNQLSLKSKTCTECAGVYAAGISVKAGAHYPGRPPVVPCATGVKRRRDATGGVSRGHISRTISGEGPNLKMMMAES